MMIFYGTIVVLLFLLLIIGAGALFRRQEQIYEDEIEAMRRETDHLRERIENLSQINK